MLKIAYITIMIILITVMSAGCAGIMNAPAPAPTATPVATGPAMQPNQTITANTGKPTPTLPPDALVHGVVTVDGKPVEKYQITVAFPVSMGLAHVRAETGSDGSYVIRMDPKQLRNMTFYMLRVSDNNNNMIYSDDSTYRIDGQPLNFAFSTQSGSPSLVPPSSPISARITPTPPDAEPIRTAKAPVKTEYTTSFVEFKVYEDKVIVRYLSGQGKLYVESSAMGGYYGESGGYLREPGNNLTLAFDMNMHRELPEGDAIIKVYHPAGDDVSYEGVEYYPRTGIAKPF